MKKIVATLVASALAALTLVAPVSPAAAADGTYPAAQCDIQVSSTTVRSGEPFTVTVRVINDIRADLSATYRGVTRSKQDALELKAKFVAPRTDRDLRTQVTTTCDGRPGSVADIFVVGADGADGADGVGDADADAGDANGILPGTGGTDLWLLLLGVLLLAAGVGAAAQRRRR